MDDIDVEKEVIVNEPKKLVIDDVEVGSLFGRVLKWSDLNLTLLPSTVNALSLKMDAQCQQEIQVHVRANINGSEVIYEFLCGGQGNTESSVLKRSSRGKEAELACVFCGRICSERVVGQYWFNISFQDNHEYSAVRFVQVSMGIGSIVGEKIVLLGKDKDIFGVDTIEILAIGITSGRSPLIARNVRVETSAQPLLPISDVLCVMSDSTGTDLLTEPQRQEYAAACDAARRRVAKFGGEYKNPDVKQFLDSKVEFSLVMRCYLTYVALGCKNASTFWCCCG
jgi:hypothetical protein